MSTYLRALVRVARPVAIPDLDYGKLFHETLATKLQYAHAILAEIGRPSR